MGSKKRRVTVHLSPLIHDDMQAVAAAQGDQLGAFVAELVTAAWRGAEFGALRQRVGTTNTEGETHDE